jgi:hypothetical protein
LPKTGAVLTPLVPTPLAGASADLSLPSGQALKLGAKLLFDPCQAKIAIHLIDLYLTKTLQKGVDISSDRELNA